MNQLFEISVARDIQGKIALVQGHARGRGHMFEKSGLRDNCNGTPLFLWKFWTSFQDVLLLPVGQRKTMLHLQSKSREAQVRD